MNHHIAKPWLALGVVFGIALVLNVYGMRDGAITIFAFLAAVLIYKLLAGSTN